MGRPRIRPIVVTKCAHCKCELVVTLDADNPHHNRFCSMEHRNLFKVGKPGKIRWTTKELIEEYRRLVDLVGKRPTFDEIKRLGRISIRVFQNRFGTLDNIANIAYPNTDFDADQWDIESVSDGDGGWLAGMCNGEGCFRVCRHMRATRAQFSMAFSIQLRADDAQSLTEFKRILGISDPLIMWDRSKDVARGINAGDGVKLHIRDIPILRRRLVPLLEKYPMRGKKQNELPVFKRGVEIMHEKRRSGRSRSKFTEGERIELDQIYWDLRDLKKYFGNIDALMEKHSAARVGSLP